MTDIELVVTDLDGTLWRTPEVVQPRVREAWTAILRAGIPILAASGRRVASMREALGQFGWRPPVVALDGALGIDLLTDREFHRHVFDPASASEVLSVFRARSLDPCIYVEHQDVDVYISDHPATNPKHVEYLGESVQVGDLEEVVATVPVFAFGLIGCPLDWLTPVVAGLAGLATASLNRSFDFDGGALTVVPLGLSKWNGVLAYCDKTGINNAAVLAIGDGPNDVELLRHAELSVSLTGSHPSALAVAQHIVASVEQGGWAELPGLLGH